MYALIHTEEIIEMFDMTITDMLESVVGYEPHFNKIDAEVAHDGVCDCGKRRMYRGFKKGDSYKCFSVCETCNDAYEF